MVTACGASVLHRCTVGPGGPLLLVSAVWWAIVRIDWIQDVRILRQRIAYTGGRRLDGPGSGGGGEWVHFTALGRESPDVPVPREQLMLRGYGCPKGSRERSRCRLPSKMSGGDGPVWVILSWWLREFT